MAASMERLKPIGFWSYARQDDEMSDGRLSRLRYQLAAELQLIYGKQTIKIFQDVAAIPPGVEWEKAIDDAIDQATFFIPILTPAFLESEWCCREVEKFLAREAVINAQHPELAGRRRIFPIRYIGSRNAEPFDPAIFAALGKVQETDFQSLRRESDQSPHVRDKLVTLADTLAELLQVRVRRPPTPAEAEAERRREQAAADAQRAALAEQERRQIEAAAETERRRADAERDAAAEAERVRIAEEAAATLAAEDARARLADAAARQARARQRSAERRAMVRRWLASPWTLRLAAIAGIVACAVIFAKMSPKGSSGSTVVAPTPTPTPPPPATPVSRLPDPKPNPRVSPAPILPNWIRGRWQVVGKDEDCPIVIEPWKTGGVMFARYYSSRFVVQKFEFDPASPDRVRTPSALYERTADGEIDVTAGTTGSKSRLQSCTF